MAEDTQGTKTESEETEESTQEKKEPTGYKTEKEYNKALQTGVSKGLESIQRQLDIRRTETDTAKSETGKEKSVRQGLELELKDLHDEILAITSAIEEPAVKKGALSKSALGDERRRVIRITAEAEQKLADVEVKTWRLGMDAMGKKLVTETGIDINEFIGCKTEADMEVKALRYSIANPKKSDEKEESEEKETKDKFAGGGTSGGKTFKELSPEDKISRVLNKLK
ncbi:hypothetical protein LCGC14_2937850 [marine sediment metagenome]|uniref:Uncharacterized protein n=1 Tax=marine sediment metagenome TaxID=412755 RepID=A0A0F8XIX3_9ZZZZ